MALTSPGVEVSIIDQSQYLPAPGGSVPLVVLATAQNKADASGTAVAAATTAANAGKLFQVTSQRDLVNLYGSPFFYTTSAGTPVQGYELNEYGLMAAYSLLGVTNRCYVLRADIDLASLVGQTGRPSGFVANGTTWLDTSSTNWGIYQFNASTGKFTAKTPIVITDAANLSTGLPLLSIGNIGDYAVDAIQSVGSPTDTYRTYFSKIQGNAWAVLGSKEWQAATPVVSTTISGLLVSKSFLLTAGTRTATISYTSTDSAASLEVLIDALGWVDVTASSSGDVLSLYASQAGADSISISATADVLQDLGLIPSTSTAVSVTYYQPTVEFGTSAQMPAWTVGQSFPRPSGSVWIKVGAQGSGLTPAVSSFDSATGLWSAKNVSMALSDWAASAAIDATGGKAIPAGTVYGQYNFNGDFSQGPIYLWERAATGATVVTGSAVPAFISGTHPFTVKVSLPGGTLSGEYTVTVPSSSTASGFVTAWSAANVPYTTASVTTAGTIQITHTYGGEIIMNDYVAGVSNGVLAAAGFNIGTTPGCKYGPELQQTYGPLPIGTTGTTVVAYSGLGSGATFNIAEKYGRYIVSVVSGGSGFTIDNTKSFTVTGGPALVFKVSSHTAGVLTGVSVVSGAPTPKYKTQLSNWREFEYISNESKPVAAPANGTNWFFSVVDEADIMVQKGSQWKGYLNTGYDSAGHPSSAASATNATGPLVSATAPTTQSDGTALEYGDLWINTSDLENYPVISRWQNPNGTPQWVLIDNSDQTSSSGIVFADARWGLTDSIDPSQDLLPSITSLLSDNHLDLDAPNPALYPQGTLLFNTRRSGYNVKQYRTNYFNATDFPDQTLPTVRSAWVSASGNQSNGAAYMGRKAQRAMVVQALNSAVATNTAARDEDNFFNLMAAPGYPELQPAMVTLNNDRGMTGYIIGDTPMRLADDATQIQAWATNAAGAASTGEAGCVTRDTYLGLFYPSAITNDLAGNQVVVPASHMMLRTFLRNDNVAYPWLAAAGTRRGTIDNVSNIGYLDAATGEFQTIKTRLGIRDVLYTNNINPCVFFTGVGLLNYGNKTSFNSSSALDRSNVARLVAYIRRQLTIATRPFVFEPNDALTRNQVAGVIQTLMVDLVAKRGLYDYLVVCDESNNTPARIDRNELWIDVAVEPVKAAEFIYIPVRILNTGELKA
jgi:hypothetical protein